MERTPSAKETACYTQGEYSTHWAVQIKDGAENWIDYSSLEGRNWIESVEYGTDVDDLVASATIELRLEEHNLSLAPLVSASKFNLANAKLDVVREVVIHTATIPLGATPSAVPVAYPPTESGDWRLVFHGYTDEIDTPFAHGDGVIKITCRDRGAKLQDAWIEKDGRNNADATDYVPSSEPFDLPVETVMQRILDDWSPLTVSLYTPTSPNWAIKKVSQGSYGYRPAKVSVLEALNNLADQIGWKVRYKWDQATTSFRLTFYEPDRAKTTPDHTLSARQILRFGRFSRSAMGVRNKIRVVYYLNPTDTNSRSIVPQSDPASIARYGTRYMEIDEAATSAINSATEATKLALAALSDLKDVKADAEPELHYRFGLEIEDLVRLSSPTRIYDTNQDVAITSVRHKGTGKGSFTTIQVRSSTPIGSYTRWWDVIVNTTANWEANLPEGKRAAPTITATAGVRSAIIEVTTSKGRDARILGYEFHVSTTSPFTPSDSTLKAFSMSNRFEVADLTQGMTYYVKAVPIGRKGLRHSASAEVSVVPGKLAAVDLDKLDYLDIKDTGSPVADRRWQVKDGVFQAATTAGVEQAAAVRLADPIFKDTDGTPVADRMLRVVDGEIRATSTTGTEGQYIRGASLKDGTGPLAHLSSLGTFDDLANVTRRVLDDVTDGSTYKKLVGVSGGVTTSSTIGAGSVVNSALADSAVTAAELASSAVEPAKALAGFCFDYDYGDDIGFHVGTTTCPHDNTMPQSTEGVGSDSLSAADYGLNPNSWDTVVISWMIVSGSVNSVITGFVCDGTSSNAFGVSCVDYSNADEPHTLIVFGRRAGVTATRTYSSRAGMHNAGTTTINGVSSGQLYQSSPKSGILLLHFKVS